MTQAPMRMPGEERKRSVSRHGLTIDKRESITVTGVTDVISFDEESVIGETEMGVIIIRGVNLHVKKINLESGELSVTGEIDGVSYENPGAAGKSKSFMGRLFK
ncbi:MAG: sporulation protein YabP [Defluviitaleaceae bacterium]|nr:sporulation protein YabP [Defluviitaleaceae bacterium]MCL2263158.1 sporulation protein YabP [Defluviitaleaceae bacterium]